MARWTFAGSLGMMLGPLLLGGLTYSNLGWRPAYWVLAFLSGIVLLAALRLLPYSQSSSDDFPSASDFFHGVRAALAGLKDLTVLRWLLLLEFSDLMLDILYGFLALYLVDIMNLTPANAAFVLVVYTGIGLIVDFFLIPFLARVKGLDYLRLSVIIECILLPSFLLSSVLWLKLTLLAWIGLFLVCWYTILKANLFSAMPGQSGSSSFGEHQWNCW